MLSLSGGRGVPRDRSYRKRSGLWPTKLRPNRRLNEDKLTAIIKQCPRLVSRCRDQPVRFKPHPWLPRGRPLLARLSDVGPILFAGQQRFFDAVAVADEPARDRGGISPCARGGSEFGRQLWHGDIVPLGDAGQQKRPMRI